MGIQIPAVTWKWQVVILFLYCNQNRASGNLQYSVVEEAELGTLVGNVTEDLGVQIAVMSKRRIQLRPSGSGQYFAVDQQSGALTVNRTIDRESVCGSHLQCLLIAEVVLENPLELHRLQVEVLDINDNSPTFITTEQVLQITELLAYPGARFPLEEALDPDSGINGVRDYSLSRHQYFSLSLRSQADGTPIPELVIEKTLDREETAEHHLIVTAFDGGSPPRSGTSQIMVIILDFNDNAPVFDQSFYKINILENIPPNTAVVQLNATDLDEGPNAEVEYFFDSRTPVTVRQLFSLNPDTGIISTNQTLDFESCNYYEFTVRAKDKGTPQMEGSCTVQIGIEDVNDHLPEILLTSLLGQIPEDTTVGTTIGLLSVIDKDSGKNGQVELAVSPQVPFEVKSFKDHYALIINSPLDREEIPRYEITLTAKDMGSPFLSTQTTFVVNISDVNDNPPLFLNQDMSTFIQENKRPGHLLYTLSAFDPDDGSNAKFTFSLADSQHFNVSSFVSINPKSGDIYAICSFDYEQVQVLEIIAQVEDSGDPKLFSNVSVFVFILDINDNPPNVLYPKYPGELSSHVNISRSVPVGCLVTKVSAVDSDAGQNALLSYNLMELTDHFPFNISTHSGEIRTVRNFLATDQSLQKLVLVISDNGHPSLSVTTTIRVALEKHATNVPPTFYHFSSTHGVDITMYLVISLVIITVASLVTCVLLLVKCFRKEANVCHYPCWFLNRPNSDHCPETRQPTLHINTDGTLKYMDVRMDPSYSESDCYRTYFSQAADNIGLPILKPLTPMTVQEMVTITESLGIDNSREPIQQAQPNTDWRFSQAQAQRPGPSGAQQPTEEAGVWPNNQFETERLQAMILASANEAAEGGAAIGAGTGTMGLSARYGPQFTLQHVPDYRQNIYIPGTTSTLTNAAGKRDGKGPSGNKKKSGKKEKK
ncbi:protocadherin gamma-C5-like isoform X9 [Pseudophryne corroboree]|uniref:protocadherin gamma-C5-like isoform X9 n=1 Tax=Pseudophryne corroboree TaxID=495146 RepID=UPI003081FC5E